MTLMINPRIAVVAILVALISTGTSGCSLFSNANERAGEAFTEANAAIDQHNRLFAEARDTYENVKGNIESGENPSNQREEIVRAREDLQEARGHLQDAHDDLASIAELDVRQPVSQYAETFAGAVEQQLEAEATEIRFYELLEENPSLDGSREEALNLLDEVSGGYASAEEAYGEAQQLANDNSDLISPTDSGNPDSPG